MSKRGWQPLNKWKKLPPKQNEHETAAQTTENGPEQYVHGLANIGQGPMRQTSAGQNSVSLQTTGSTGQSVTEYDTIQQYAMGQDSMKLAIMASTTVDQGSLQPAIGQVTESAVLHQDAMGLLAGQGVTNDNATNQSTAEYVIEQETIEEMRGLAVAEKCAKGLGTMKHTLDMNTIKEPIIEIGALEQFALRKDAILGVMGPDAEKQCDRILATKDSSPEINSLRKPAAPVGTTGQAAKNAKVTKQISPQSSIMAQVGTGSSVIELNSHGPNAMVQYVTKADDTKQSKLDSVAMTQFNGEPYHMEQIATGLFTKEQYCPKPDAKIATQQDYMTQPTIELGYIREATTEQDSMRQFTTELVTIKQVATEHDVITSVRSDLVAVGQVAADDDVIRPYSTESGAMGLTTAEDNNIRSFGIEPTTMVQIGTRQNSTQQSSTEADTTGQTIKENDTIRPLNIERSGIATTDEIEQAAVILKLRRSEVEGTLSLPAIHISTTEQTVTSQTAIELPLRQSTTELGAMGPNVIGPDVIRPLVTKLGSIEEADPEPNALKQFALGHDDTRWFYPESVDMEQTSTRQDTLYSPNQYSSKSTNNVGQSAVVYNARRSVVVGDLSQSGINVSTPEFENLRHSTRGSVGIGQFTPSSTWTQTDLYSESTQRQEEYYPLHRTISRKTYLPDWIDLDRRPLPRWYDEAKVGIVVHWGLYTVPSFKSEWFWYLWKKGNKEILEFMTKMYRAGFTYQEFGSLFKAQYFDPVEWATLFAKAGAKYVILTAKHHDGFRMFPSKRSFNFNSYDIGPKRDIVKELSKAVVDKGLKFGIYYSLLEWFNPIYEEDKKTLFNARNYVNEVVWPELMQLVNSYEPSILWTDGDWEANEYYWKSEDFISWVYNDSPIRDDVVVNNRWGCKEAAHGDFYNRDERHKQPIHESIFTKFHKWEVSVTMDKQLCWCHRRDIKFNEIMTIEELLLELVSTVSCGGNILINVGPTEDGIIAPLFEERLLQLGEWLEINGEAIYASSPWIYQVDEMNDNIYYTCIKDHYDPYKTAAPPSKTCDVSIVYTIFFTWPLDSIVKLRNIMAFMKETPCVVMLLGENMYLTANVIHDKVYILLPDKAKVKSNFAWTLKFITKSLLKDDLGSIVIPVKDTVLKLSKSGSKLGSKTGMKSTSRILRLGSTSKSYARSGSKMKH